jgi:hypothetical protein
LCVFRCAASIKDEIIAIEKAIVALSSSFHPSTSVANYEKIKAKLELKHAPVIEMETLELVTIYRMAAAILLMIGIGFQYNQLEETSNQVVSTEIQKIES